MMIFFNVPIPDPVERAMRMALAMRERVMALISKRVLALTDGLLDVESAGELSLTGFHRSSP